MKVIELFFFPSIHAKKYQSNRAVILKMNTQQYIRYGHHIASAFMECSRPGWMRLSAISWKVSLAITEGLVLDGLQGLFQAKPFYASLFGKMDLSSQKLRN